MWVEDVEGEFAARGFRGAVLTEGLTAPPLRAWEEEARVRSSALIQWFGSKDRIMPRAAEAYVVRMEFMLRERVTAFGWPGFLPQASDDADDVRVWLAWEEIARQRTDVAERLAVFHLRVRERLAATPGAPGAPWTDTVELVLHGLWNRVAAGALTEADRALWQSLPERLRDVAAAGGVAPS